MAYCRFSDDSDLYIYSSSWFNPDHRRQEHIIVCCACRLRPPFEGDHYQTDTQCRSPEAMIEHVRQHELAGHKVPDCVYERLEREIGVKHG